MTRILIDTDVLIDYSKGYNQLLGVLLEKQDNNELELWINPVILAEFFTDIHLKKKDTLEKAMEFISLFRVVEIGKKIGLLAGQILREEKAGFLGDALIAATCISEKLLLATGNKKHFSKISGLEFFLKVKKARLSWKNSKTVGTLRKNSD